MTETFTTPEGLTLSYERRGSGPLLVCHPGGPGRCQPTAKPRERMRFAFPRQEGRRRLCIADFFRPVESGQYDVLGVQLVTVGDKVTEVRRIQVVDSHTGGEPTRIVIEGGPGLGTGTIAERRALLRDRYDWFRSAVVNEPRGSDVIVGALLCPPSDPTCSTGVIFFNNVGYLGMCGHGTIGLLVTLAHLGRVKPGAHRIDTPVGVVTATLHDSGAVTVRNVPSYRLAARVGVEVEGLGRVTGDIAWGGNWFFLVHDHREELTRGNVERLTDVSWRIRQAV